MCLSNLRTTSIQCAHIRQLDYLGNGKNIRDRSNRKLLRFLQFELIEGTNNHCSIFLVSLRGGLYARHVRRKNMSGEPGTSNESGDFRQVIGIAWKYGTWVAME